VGLTRDTQFLFGVIVVAINLVAYGIIVVRARRTRAR
jgi:hypothetical protein